jgi:chemotaxis protein methyltransferase WspC
MLTTDFDHLLKSAIGLDVGSIGSSSIERAVLERQSACRLPDLGAYLEFVRTCDAELQSLIEAVVVPETWFFRDREAFTKLARAGHAEWLRGPAPRVLRLLSLPSSTGEEPYSMAMTLLDAGVPADRFRIDAIDISARVITHAGHGVYRRNSFRGHDLSFRDRYFDAVPDGHRLKDAVRRQVKFQQGNLLDDAFLPGRNIYDMVFCRNLLIYFDRPTQDRAVSVLQRLLASTGILFVAPSETGLLLSHAFESTKVPMAFAFRMPGAGPRAPTPRLADPVAAVQGPPRTVRAATPSATARPRQARTRTAQPPIPSPAEPRSALDAGLRLADQGRFREASSCYEQHVREHGPSAEAYHLMGLVQDAGGNQSVAAECYRKALYLDPQHHDTLIHLALLVEEQGHAVQGQVLRDRAQRVNVAGRIQ